MISDYVMNNIDRNIGQGLSKNSSVSLFLQKENLPSQRLTEKKSSFNRELIKERLPSLIRKNSEQKFVINESLPKSPSPISKSKLKTVLEHQKKQQIDSVVKKRLSFMDPKTDESSSNIKSKANLLKTDMKKSYGDLFQQNNKENNVISFYREERKLEQEKDQQSKSSLRLNRNPTSKSPIYIKSHQASAHDFYL